ncbi:MAG: HWE histidine kinase domain-containing protein, partial [Hyphomicrobiaceae bacterium]
DTPTAQDVEALARFIDGRAKRDIMATHVLVEHYPPARHWKCQSKGLLAIPLSNSNSDWLFFFRREITQVVEWAGNPNKAPDAKLPGATLSPRSSFAAWREVVKGQSLPWTSRERLIGETLRVYLLDIIVRFSEVILEERRQAEQQSRLLSNQLNHRVKVTLELIQSLVHHGFEAELRVRDFVRTLEGRIKAIALAHDAISMAGGCELRHLVESTIALQTPAYGHVHILGPEIRLDAKAYTVLALVVHELVSNSAVSGALSRRDSRLDVRWSRSSATDDTLVITWDESSASPAPMQFEDGLGMLIIKRNIPHALGGDAKIELTPDGFRAVFTIPSRHLEKGASPVPPPQHRQRLLAQPSNQLSCCTVLIVDDHMPAALDLERILQSHGATAVEIAGTVTSALERIAQVPPDVAVLDIDLGEETSFEIAEELARRDIPFIFAGRVSDTAHLPPDHRDVPVAAKPYSADDVTQLLKDALLPYLIRTVLTKLV